MTDFLKHFLTVDPQIIFKKNETEDPRLGDSYNQDPNSLCVLAGYPDDEGIVLNGGRPGSAKAPDVIRHLLSRMTPSANQNFSNFFDIGNIDNQLPLEDKHLQIQMAAEYYFKKNKKWISLGGGHDFGYPDCAAFVEVYKDKNPIVFNFDAHLDVRPLDKGLTSGTPFYRLLNNYNNFDFIEVGIQDLCNSEAHLNWCREKGGHIIGLEELNLPPLSVLENFKKSISPYIEPMLSKESTYKMTDKSTNKSEISKRPAFISLDIDVFSSSFAMGCSQSWPLGMSPIDFELIMYWLIQHFDVRGLGVYEVSPPLDLDNRTSKLAAQIVYKFLKHNSKTY